MSAADPASAAMARINRRLDWLVWIAGVNTALLVAALLKL